MNKLIRKVKKDVIISSADGNDTFKIVINHEDKPIKSKKDIKQLFAEVASSSTPMVENIQNQGIPVKKSLKDFKSKKNILKTDDVSSYPVPKIVINNEIDSKRYAKNKGILKSDAGDLIKKYAIPVESETLRIDEVALVDPQNELKNTEKKELKLLKYQLDSAPETVNSFLVNKYTDGNFNSSQLNGYDNSEKRLKAGISYEYRCFFPIALNSEGVDLFLGERPPNFMIQTNELIDKDTGDVYIYSLPIHDYDNEYYKTDASEELNKKSNSVSNGLFAAINILSYNLKNNINRLDSRNLDILKDAGFIDEKNKITLAVQGLQVEKYFKSFKEEKKKDGIKYLNEFFNPSTVKIDDISNDQNNSNYSVDAFYKFDLNGIPIDTNVTISNHTELINYLKLKNIKTKLISESKNNLSGALPETKEFPIILRKNDQQVVLFLRFSKGAQGYTFSRLLDNVNKEMKEIYNNIKNGIFKNSIYLPSILTFITYKKVDFFIKEFETMGKVGYSVKELVS